MGISSHDALVDHRAREIGLGFFSVGHDGGGEHPSEFNDTPIGDPQGLAHPVGHQALAHHGVIVPGLALSFLVGALIGLTNEASTLNTIVLWGRRAVGFVLFVEVHITDVVAVAVIKRHDPACSTATDPKALFVSMVGGSGELTYVGHDDVACSHKDVALDVSGGHR